MGKDFIVRRSGEMAFSETKRKNVFEKRLILPEESQYQNVVLVEAQQGAEIELHKINNSESIFVLRGTFEVIFPDSSEDTKLEAGDICYFNPETLHGLRCIDGPGQILVIFSPKNNSKFDDWLKLLYSEAWKQYSHEDTLCQHRNTLFYGIQGGLMTLFAIISTKNTQLNLVSLLLLAIISLVAVFISDYWKSVTQAGKAYCSLRWASIRKIEKEANLSSSIAGIEQDWKVFSENSLDYFVPFPSEPELNKIKIMSNKKIMGGWSSTLKVITILEYFWIGLLIIGLLSLTKGMVPGLFQ